MLTSETSKSQREKILLVLRNAGKEGVSNFDLSRICLRYSARVWELVHKYGFVIEGRHAGEQEYVYTLKSEPLPLFQQKRES